jgi:EAL domain-containing protein (putative c-di-GMP-specific phosphodiesterase class I)
MNSTVQKIECKQATQAQACVMEIDGKQLYSVFQPIYSFTNEACIGAEALVRGHSVVTGFKVPVYECLQVPKTISNADFSQQLNTMHLHNWQTSKLDNSWLFLNLDFQGVTNLSDVCMGDLISKFKMPGHELVIEVVESEIRDEALFEEIVCALRKLGCLIALDDFGAGHSNIDRIWKAKPDIVKLDRGVLLEATNSRCSQSVLRNLTRLIKEAGSVCLLEGIETKEQALLALDVGVDFVQGFYFARPRKTFDKVLEGQALIKDVMESYPAYMKEKAFVRKMQKRGYEALFVSLKGQPSQDVLEKEMDKVGCLSFVKRNFMLDEFGYQVSDEGDAVKTSGHIENLRKGKGLCWKSRRYFIKAMEYPERMYITKSYRSLIDMQLCLTISKAVQVGGNVFVACYDLVYLDKIR